MDAKKVSVSIRPSLINGLGSFADQDIPKGTLILTLTGKPFPKKHVVSSDDPLQIDANTYLDLDFASKMINHCCEPSAGIRNRSDLYALRDIQRGEEITYDYSTTIGTDDHISNMPCACESRLCRKVIGNVMSIGQDRLNYYRQLDALPQFICDELFTTA